MVELAHVPRSLKAALVQGALDVPIRLHRPQAQLETGRQVEAGIAPSRQAERLKVGEAAAQEGGVAAVAPFAIGHGAAVLLGLLKEGPVEAGVLVGGGLPPDAPFALVTGEVAQEFLATSVARPRNP